MLSLPVEIGWLGWFGGEWCFMALTDGAEFQDKCPIFTEVQRLLQLWGLRVPPYLPTLPYHSFT